MDNIGSVEEIKMTKTVQFVFHLYSMKYKEERPLNARIVGFVSRAVGEYSTDEVLRAAQVVARRAFERSLVDTIRSWTFEEKQSIKNTLERFVRDVADIISESSTNPFSLDLARRACQFKREWNQILAVMEAEGRFENISAAELKIANAAQIIQFLTKLRKARSIARELSVLHDKRNQKAIVKNIQASIAIRQRANSVK